MSAITTTNNKIEEIEKSEIETLFETDLRKLLRKCYQCGRCSGVCQLSKVQKYPTSRIIQLILEGFEEKVFESRVLWDCLTCNSCLQNCPEDINFADIARIGKYHMKAQSLKCPDECIAHKAVYTTISELMSQSYIQPKRNLDWIPKKIKVSTKGNTLYYVGCLPFFNYEFENIDPIAVNTLSILNKIENEPIVVFEDEICCGHDIYWGQGKLNAFVELAKKNKEKFEKASISQIITACAECYRTFKVDYSTIFNDFNEEFKVKHLIEYIYDNWKENKITFTNPLKNKERIQFTYHDPCRLSRFLPKDNNINEQIREIFNAFKELGYDFNEMKHNKEDSLCCGVSSWMNCNEKSKALRYKRMLEAKDVGDILVTTCPKCRIHFTCLQNDIEEIASIKIMDLSEFLFKHIEIEK